METTKFDKEFEQILLGSLLGDGGIKFRPENRDKNPYYHEKHSSKQNQYLKYKLSKFKKYFVVKIKDVYDKNYQKDYPEMVSNSSLNLHNYFKIFYPTGKGYKIITKNILNKINWQGIAIWYLDDGSYCYATKMISITQNKLYHQISINFFKRLGFDFKIHNMNIRLNTEQSQKFIEKIKPYVLKIPKSMHYKIGLDKNKINQAIIKRRSYNIFNSQHNKEYCKKYKLKNKQNLIIYSRYYEKNVRRRPKGYIKNYNHNYYLNIIKPKQING